MHDFGVGERLARLDRRTGYCSLHYLIGTGIALLSQERRVDAGLGPVLPFDHLGLYWLAGFDVAGGDENANRCYRRRLSVHILSAAAQKTAGKQGSGASCERRQAEDNHARAIQEMVAPWCSDPNTQPFRKGLTLKRFGA